MPEDLCLSFALSKKATQEICYIKNDEALQIDSPFDSCGSDLGSSQCKQLRNERTPKSPISATHLAPIPVVSECLTIFTVFMLTH